MVLSEFFDILKPSILFYDSKICTAVRTPGVYLPRKFCVSACHRSESAELSYHPPPLAVLVMKKGLAWRG